MLLDDGVLAWTSLGRLAANLQVRCDFLNANAPENEHQLASTVSVSCDLASLTSGMVLPSETPDLSEFEVAVLWGALQRVNADLVARRQASLFKKHDNASVKAKEDVEDIGSLMHGLLLYGAGWVSEENAVNRTFMPSYHHWNVVVVALLKSLPLPKPLPLLHASSSPLHMFFSFSPQRRKSNAL